MSPFGGGFDVMFSIVPVIVVIGFVVILSLIDTHMHHSSSSTTYFTAFEVESGDRIELRVLDTEYGMLAPNDIGKLTFQGTRYKGFTRERA